MAFDVDVLIAGGGLAGLALARQLRLEAPGLRVLVAEKRPHPAPEAAFKVGESTVEIAAHYFHTRLALASHLRSSQLEKFGLRYFFPSGGNRDIASRFELGPSAFPPVPSFQLDRGRFENMLLAEERAAGTEVLDATTVIRVDLDSDGHVAELQAPAGARRVRAAWFVDATGRHGLLRRKLDLNREARHDANASWFRIADRVKVDDWSADSAWQARVPAGERWLSTNHLMGPGYWVWLIPLASGSTSIGIVADHRLHPPAGYNRFERAMTWLRAFEPQCAEAVEASGGEIEDFLSLRHFAHGSGQVYSGDGRWALIGEAGPFTDPFYSPGSDFIAMGNEFVADLIARERAGEDIRGRAALFDTTYLRLFDAFHRLYDGQYPMMGHPLAMTAKIAWDNGCYWGVTALLFYQRRLRDVAFLGSIDGLMKRFFVLHARMQEFLRVWARAEPREAPAAAASVVAHEKLCELQGQLGDPPLDADALRARLHANVEWLERFAASWRDAAAREGHPGLARLVPVADVEPAGLDPLLVDLARVTRP